MPKINVFSILILSILSITKCVKSEAFFKESRMSFLQEIQNKNTVTGEGDNNKATAPEVSSLFKKSSIIRTRNHLFSLKIVYKIDVSLKPNVQSDPEKLKVALSELDSLKDNFDDFASMIDLTLQNNVPTITENIEGLSTEELAEYTKLTDKSLLWTKTIDPALNDLLDIKFTTVLYGKVNPAKNTNDLYIISKKLAKVVDSFTTTVSNKQNQETRSLYRPCLVVLTVKLNQNDYRHSFGHKDQDAAPADDLDSD